MHILRILNSEASDFCFCSKRKQAVSIMSVSQPNPTPNHLLPGYDPGVFIAEQDFVVCMHFSNTKTQYVEDSTPARKRYIEEMLQRLSNGLIQNPCSSTEMK